MNTKNGRPLLWILQEIFLFIVGGIVYYGIEIIWRGYSHISMMILGGLCFVVIGLINELFSYEMKFEYQVVIGDVIVTLLEFVAGFILNIKMGLNIWDYSNVPLNICGQICVPYMFLWLFLVALAIIVDDWMKYKISKFLSKYFDVTVYPRPHYNFLIKTLI